jgi:glycosyltransferase involved in cell wall biosynthesis
MKTGIFISGRSPNEGGGYTITYDIFNNLVDRINENNKNNFYFILVNDNDNYLKIKLNEKKIEFFELKKKKFFIFLSNLIFNLFPSILLIYRFCNLDKLHNLEKEKKISIVWYLSAEHSYSIFKNYIATVWDLMHITNPEYPEVGNFFVKFYRSYVTKDFLKNSYKIITGTDYLIKLLNKLYDIDFDKIIKLEHPTPTAFLKAKTTKNYLKISKFFLYPANFWQHKNHINLLKGFNLFNIKQKLKYKLVLVGSCKDIKYYNKCINIINYSKSKNNIILLNFVSLNKLINLYDSCEALIYSSYCGPENLPPLEAFARNKPVLISEYFGASLV